MVYNTTRHIRFPHSNMTMAAHTRRPFGKGVGAVLLRDAGGAGSASSYMDMDDYIRTTGRDPNAYKTTSGKGLASIASKLSHLKIETPKHMSKKKNIVMNM